VSETEQPAPIAENTEPTSQPAGLLDRDGDLWEAHEGGYVFTAQWTSDGWVSDGLELKEDDVPTSLADLESDLDPLTSLTSAELAVIKAKIAETAD
jgi:hypothetical protein